MPIGCRTEKRNAVKAADNMHGFFAEKAMTKNIKKEKQYRVEIQD